MHKTLHFIFKHSDIKFVLFKHFKTVTKHHLCKINFVATVFMLTKLKLIGDSRAIETYRCNNDIVTECKGIELKEPRAYGSLGYFLGHFIGEKRALGSFFC